LRLAFFMDFLPFAISFSLAHSTFSGKNRCVAFLRGQLIETGPVSVGAAAFRWHIGSGVRWPKRQTPPSGREAALAGFAELVCEIRVRPLNTHLTLKVPFKGWLYFFDVSFLVPDPPPAASSSVFS
jgi:hypothetical protein